MSNNIENKEIWEKPYNLKENLLGSVRCLNETLNTLKTTISTLDTTINAFDKQHKLSEYTRHSEIYLEEEVEAAGQQVLSFFLPEIEKKLQDIRSFELIQENKEADLKHALKRQQQDLQQREIELEREKEKANTRKKQMIGTTNKKSAHKSVAEQREIRRLEKLIEERNRQCLKEEREIEEMSRRDYVPSYQTHENNRKHELESQLAELEIMYNAKITQNKVEPNKTITGSASQYKNHLNYINDIILKLQKIDPTPSTIENCKGECNKYLEILKFERLSVNLKNTKKEEELWIARIAMLCRSLLKHGKTAGKVLELILQSNNKSILIEFIKKEFPSSTERRHQISDTIQLLIRADILKIDTEYLSLK